MSARMSAEVLQFQDESSTLNVIVQPQVYFLTSAIDQNPIQVQQRKHLSLP